MQTRQQPVAVPELQTDRLRLRGHRRDDFDMLARIWADERVVRFISGRPSTRNESWTRLLAYMGHWQALGFGYWAVEDRQTGAYIGDVGFADYKREITPPIDGIPEIGWVLAPEAQGRGFATEAVAAVLAWGDRIFPGDVTVCLFDPQHQASIRVAEKNGFSKRCDSTYRDQPTLIMHRSRPLVV